MLPRVNRTFMAALLVASVCVAACGSSNSTSAESDAGEAQATAPVVDASEGSSSDSPTNLSDSSAGSDGAAPTLRGHVAYVAFPTGGTGVIYVAPVDGSVSPRPVSVAGYVDSPKFSLDGMRLYYSHRVASGREIREVGVDGTNDHVVVGQCASYFNFCYALGDDSTGRVFAWVSNQTGLEGSLVYLATTADGGPALVPWPGDPGCTLDAALSASASAIAITGSCPQPKVFLGDPAATSPVVGHDLTTIDLASSGAHVQTAGGRLFARGFPIGTDAGPLSPVHVYSLAADGTGPQDLNVGDDAGDFVVADDASFVLVSHGPTISDGGALPLHSIVAQAGSWKMPIQGLDAIPSFSSVSLGWTRN